MLKPDENIHWVIGINSHLHYLGIMHIENELICAHFNQF